MRDKITIASATLISSVKVSIDITHTFIGDLRLTVTAPSGTAIGLRDRNGGNAQNIQKTFDLTSTPTLGSLAGQSAKGDWILLVQDLAAADTGRLNRWELEIKGQQDAFVSLSETPGITIPDNSLTGIERTLSATESGTVKDVEIAIDITHTFIGDLQVSLVSPAGTVVPLHQRTGDDADNLIKTYTTATTPQLQALRGQPVQGAWRLRVNDLEKADEGKLNKWSLKIAREP